MKTSSNARSIFTSVVKGKNFMTPYLIGYYDIANGAAELTEGDFMGDTVYGVTLVVNNEHDCELSKSFESLEEAEEYIKSFNTELTHG